MISAVLVITIASTVYGQDDPNTLDPVSGRSLSLEKVIPADVLARVELLREELELIRFEMGQPKEQQPEITVTNVARARSCFRH